MALTNISQIIKELINYTTSTLSIDNYTSENLAKAIGDPSLVEKLVNQRGNYWQEFLKFLQNEQNSGQLGHYFVRANDIRESSIFDFIQANADLDQNGELFEQLLENYLDHIKDSSVELKTHWNESISVLINYYINNYLKIDLGLTESYEYGLEKVSTWANGSWLIEDIKNGDAGASFNFTTTGGESLVIPWYNIDKDTFYKVERSDIVLSVVNKETKLQFTRTQNIDKWFRLLMPQYNRRFEVIDLNRNFWVIAQGISAVSEALFNPNNPTFNILSKIISEIVQLWENVLFLWALLALWWAAKNTSKQVHVEFVPLPNDIYQPNQKYDGFSTSPNLSASAISERIMYLIDKYEKQNLVVIPIIRYDNYKFNYYHTEAYPYIFFHTAGSSGYTYLKLNFTDINASARFNIDDFEGFKLYGMQDLKNGRAYYGYPFERISKSHEDIPKGYYAALRVVPAITATVNKGIIKINTFRFKVYDAVRESINTLPKGSSTLKKTYTKADGNWDSAHNGETVYMSTSDQGTDKTRRAIFSMEPVALNRGLYKGELATSFTKSIFIPLEFDVIQIPEVEFSPSARQVDDQIPLLTYAQNSLTQGWDGHLIEEDEEERHLYFYVFTSKRGSLDGNVGTSQTYSYVDTNALNQGQKVIKSLTTTGSADYWLTGCVLYDPFKKTYITTNPKDQIGFGRLKGISFGEINKETYNFNGINWFKDQQGRLSYFPGVLEAPTYKAQSYNADMSWSINDMGWDFLNYSYVTDENHYIIQGVREYSDGLADEFNGGRVPLYRSIIIYNPIANTLQTYNKTPQRALNTPVETVGLVNKNAPNGAKIFYEWGYTSIAKQLLNIYYNLCTGTLEYSPNATFDYKPYPNLRYRLGFYQDAESLPYYINANGQFTVRPV